MRLRTTTVLGALVALAVPAAATAATPGTAKVTPTAKTASWTGDITDPVDTYDLFAFFNGSTQVGGQETCMAPYCDTFKLDVADGGTDLILDFSAPDSDNIAAEVIAPDGTATNYNDVDTVQQRRIELPPDAGTWTIKTYGGGVYTYTAKATLSTDPLPAETAAASARRPSRRAKARKAAKLRAARAHR